MGDLCWLMVRIAGVDFGDAVVDEAGDNGAVGGERAQRRYTRVKRSWTFKVAR